MTMPQTCSDPESWRTEVAVCWDRFGIDSRSVAARKLPLIHEPAQLQSIGADIFGREQWLSTTAAKAWTAMQTAAAQQGVTLLAVSAFRSLDYQAGLLQRKLDAGQALADILRVNAPPGCSEHHSGCALDLATPGDRPLQESFEHTVAFEWLQHNSARYGFHLSFPRDHPAGFIYEPWHWCHDSVSAQCITLQA